MKKILALLCICALMLAGGFTLPAKASTDIVEGTCGDKLIWRLSSNGRLTISGSGEMDGFCEENLEAMEWEYTAPWNAYANDIETVVLEEGVISVSDGAFFNVRNVTNIYLPSTLTRIGPRAFCNTKNTTVHITDLPAFLNIKMDIHVGEWGSVNAYPNCSPMNNASLVLNDEPVATLVIPEGVTAITGGLLYGCRGIDTVHFPASLNNIGAYAFADSSVKNVHFVGEKLYFREFAFDTDLDNVYVDSLENWLTYYFNISFCAGGEDEGDTEALPTNPLFGCGNFYVGETLVTDLHIPDGTTAIAEGAFVGYPKLQSVSIPDTVTTIGSAAFMQCRNLSEIHFAGNAPLFDIVTIHCTAICENDCEDCYDLYAFSGVKATAFLPKNNATWTNSVKLSTGGDITWQERTALAITAQPQSVAADEGETARVTVTAVGDGLTYCWYVRDVGDTKWYESSNKTATYKAVMDSTKDGREAYCIIKDQYGNFVKSETVTLSLKKVLEITKQPTSVQVLKGETARATVAAVGDGLTYHWFVRDVGDTKWYESSNKTVTYKVVMDSTKDGREAYCIIKDQYGDFVKTKTITFSIKKAVKITKQPASVTVAKGATAKVTVKATGDGLTYRWYYKNAGASKYTYSTTCKGNSYQITMNAARNGRVVYCRVYDKYGNVVQSKTVKLSMKQTAKITKQPTSVKVAKGATAKVTVKATGDGLTYRWYYKNAGASKYVKSSVTGSSYQIKMTATTNGRTVYCRVYDKYGNMVQSKTVKLSMKQTAKITKQPASVTVTKGKTAKVTVKATGDGLTYRWYYKNAGASKFVKSSVTGSSYQIKMTATTNGRTVYCRVYDKYGNMVQSKTVKLSMKK